MATAYTFEIVEGIESVLKTLVEGKLNTLGNDSSSAISYGLLGEPQLIVGEIVRGGLQNAHFAQAVKKTDTNA